jgi:hypothetical protein
MLKISRSYYINEITFSAYMHYNLKRFQSTTQLTDKVSERKSVSIVSLAQENCVVLLSAHATWETKGENPAPGMAVYSHSFAIRCHKKHQNKVFAITNFS